MISLKLHGYVNRQAAISWPSTTWNKNKTNRNKAQTCSSWSTWVSWAQDYFHHIVLALHESPNWKGKELKLAGWQGLQIGLTVSEYFQANEPIKRTTLDVLITKFSTTTPSFIIEVPNAIFFSFGYNHSFQTQTV